MKAGGGGKIFSSENAFKMAYKTIYPNDGDYRK